MSMEFDVARVLVELETGGLSNESRTNGAAEEAVSRGLVVMDYRLTDAGRQRLANFRRLVAPVDDDDLGTSDRFGG